MISAETIEQVKAKIDLVDVIGTYVRLKKKGADYEGLCPFHSEKTPSFKVHPGKGIYKCFGCGRSGDGISFLMDHENLTYPQAIEKLAERYHVPLEVSEGKKLFEKPVPRLEKLSKKSLDYLEGQRGISNNTLLRMQITEAIEWMPQFEKEVPVICFNYFRGNELVNIKFRGPKKSFKLAKGAELIFYNLDALQGEKEAIIVEGEMDCLTCVDCGVCNVVSVPNGAGIGNLQLEYLDRCYEAFEDKVKIILATDNDHPGLALREELARRLGIDRCYIVEYPEGCKDINEVKLKHGADKVKKILGNAKEWPIRGIFTTEQLAPTVYDWYYHGYPKGASSKIPGFDQFLTLAPGQITTITGIPSHGKDEFTNWLMVQLSVHAGWIWGDIGFEESAPETITKLAEKFTKRAFGFRHDISNRIAENQLDWALAMIDQYFKILDSDEIEPTLGNILEVATTLVKRFGIKGFRINPWNWVLQDRGNKNETDTVSDMYSEIIRWSRKWGVHVIVIAHPTKVQKGPDGRYVVPTLYSISGSAHFYNKTHNGITVYRDSITDVTTIYIQKVKQSWYGQIGWAAYRYNTLTRQYEYVESSLTGMSDNQQSFDLPPGNWKPISEVRDFTEPNKEEELF